LVNDNQVAGYKPTNSAGKIIGYQGEQRTLHSWRTLKNPFVLGLSNHGKIIQFNSRHFK
jgi:hypothetical protein